MKDACVHGTSFRYACEECDAEDAQQDSGGYYLGEQRGLGHRIAFPDGVTLCYEKDLDIALALIDRLNNNNTAAKQPAKCYPPHDSAECTKCHPQPARGEGWQEIAFRMCPDSGLRVSKQGHRLAYGGVPSCWQVKPEDFPPEAFVRPPQEPSDSADAVPVAQIIHSPDAISRMVLLQEGVCLGMGTHNLYTHPPSPAQRPEGDAVSLADKWVKRTPVGATDDEYSQGYDDALRHCASELRKHTALSTPPSAEGSTI